MKRIIAVYPNDATPDLTSLMACATEFRIETTHDNGVVKKPRKRGAKGSTTLTSVMNHFTPQGIFTRLNAESWVKADNYAGSSAGPALSALCKQGKVRNLGALKYQFVSQ